MQFLKYTTLLTTPRLLAVSLAVSFVALMCTGCGSSWEDIQGKVEKVERVSPDNTALYRDGDTLKKFRFGSVKEVAYKEDVKEGEPMWVHYRGHRYTGGGNSNGSCRYYYIEIHIHSIKEISNGYAVVNETAK